MTDRQILKIIGQNVREARLRANMTLECLAELVGVHWHTILYVEQGKFPFSVATFARVSQALETSPNRLLDGMPEPDVERTERIKKAMARKRKPKSGQLGETPGS